MSAISIFGVDKLPEWMRPLPEPDPSAGPIEALTPRGLCVAGAVLFVAVVARRPDVVFGAQFYAEDGLFYSAAYNEGIRASLGEPVAGYFYVTARLAAALSQFVPFQFGPLLFNLLAVAGKLAPALLFLSRRFERSFRPSSSERSVARRIS